MKISIVVPCYNESEAIPYFYEEIQKVFPQMDATYELVFVDDGSKDSSLEVMKSLAKKDERVIYLSFSRNFGKEAAIYAGLQHSTGDLVVIMDADLQDPPAMLPKMYRYIVEEGYDSVATRRVTRKGEPPIRSFFARLFYRLMNKISKTELVDGARDYRLMNKISKTELVDGARDYRLMNRKFVDALLELGEYNRFSKGLFGWVGFRTKWLEYENVERVAGETKWSFWSLLVYAVDGILAFSTAPLVLSTLAGVIIGLLALIFLIVIIVRKLIFGDPVDGWASTASIILMIGGIQLFCIGILGQYLAKAYLESKRRPIYILNETNRTGTQTGEQSKE